MGSELFIYVYDRRKAKHFDWILLLGSRITKNVYNFGIKTWTIETQCVPRSKHTPSQLQNQSVKTV
jgi:hypothetical protein